MSEERARERLAYEVGLARNQLAGEQREREAAERRLTSEVEELRRRCQGCNSTMKNLLLILIPPDLFQANKF